MSPRLHTELLTYRLGYSAGLFGALLQIGRFVPRAAAAAIAHTVSAAYTATHPLIVDVVAANLRVLENREIPRSEAAAVFREFALTLADYFWLGSRPVAQGFALIDFAGGVEALRSTNGGILATGHYGFFELGAIAMRRIGLPISVVTFAEPSAALTAWRAAYRKRWGAETIEIGTDPFSSLRAHDAVRAGRFTAMLVDRPAGGRTVDVALPGGTIPFSASPALLAWMTGAPIVPVSVRRLPNARYVIRAGDPITVDRSAPRAEALAQATRVLAGALCSEFRANPRQWYHFVPLSPTA